MPKKMKAAIWSGPSDIRVKEVDIPEIGPDDLLLKVRTVGICGSDLHSYKLGHYIDPGQIMGHEFCGEVAEVGQKVKDIRTGERGTGFQVNVCGSCYWCKAGQFTFCPSLFGHSTAYGLPGAFAEYIRIPNAVRGVSYHPIPDEIDDLTAATIEPVSVAVGTVNACGPVESDKVVVLGGGIIGNAIMQVFKASPVAKVVLTDLSERRLAVARDTGADAVINAATEDVMVRLKEEVGIGPYHFGEGTMADIVVEAAGVPETVEASFEIVRSCGVIAFVGLAEKKAILDVNKIVHKCPRIIGCLAGDMNGAMELLKTGRVKTKPLITRTVPLEEIREAFELQMRGE